MKKKKKPAPPAGMDALAAHLDRGWELLDQGALAKARAAVTAALRVEPESPEALTLAGAIAAAEDDEEEALACYRRAAAVDPDYVVPLLSAAELHLARDEAEEALELVEEARAHAGTDEDRVDSALLHAETLLALGREAEARQALADVPAELPDATYAHRAAGLALDLGDVDAAAAAFRRLVDADADDADAHHGLGLCCEERDDLRGMVRHWLRVRELDAREPPPPWAMDEAAFERVAEAARGALPARVRRLLENVPILAADVPAVELVAEGFDPRMMGFFSGVPYPEKSNVSGGAAHLDSVFLYKRNIERVARNRADAEREIRITLLHETGHFFGLSEEDLEAMGLG